jgi:hypothetical protein
MSKAEEAALKAYPNVLFPFTPLDLNAYRREAFINGHETAEKETIERAIAWLKENANKYIVDLTPTYPDAPANIIVGGMCWEHLKQELEGR